MTVYDYIWTVKDPLAGSAAPSESMREGAPPPGGETSTHVAIYTLYLSGLKQRYRHFLRQPDGAIIEVGNQHILFNLSKQLLSQSNHKGRNLCLYTVYVCPLIFSKNVYLTDLTLGRCIAD